MKITATSYHLITQLEEKKLLNKKFIYINDRYLMWTNDRYLMWIQIFKIFNMADRR